MILHAGNTESESFNRVSASQHNAEIPQRNNKNRSHTASVAYQVSLAQTERKRHQELGTIDVMAVMRSRDPGRDSIDFKLRTPVQLDRLDFPCCHNVTLPCRPANQESDEIFRNMCVRAPSRKLSHVSVQPSYDAYYNRQRRLAQHPRSCSSTNGTCALAIAYLAHVTTGTK
jgi:hypothetical protein